MKSNATVREEVWRFPGRYIDSVKFLDGHLLRLNLEIHDAFGTQFRGRFVHFSDLPLQEFCSYLADFTRLREAEATRCVGVITDWEVCDA